MRERERKQMQVQMKEVSSEIIYKFPLLPYIIKLTHYNNKSQEHNVFILFSNYWEFV